MRAKHDDVRRSRGTFDGDNSGERTLMVHYETPSGCMATCSALTWARFVSEAEVLMPTSETPPPEPGWYWLVEGLGAETMAQVWWCGDVLWATKEDGTSKAVDECEGTWSPRLLAPSEQTVSDWIKQPLNEKGAA